MTTSVIATILFIVRFLSWSLSCLQYRVSEVTVISFFLNPPLLVEDPERLYRSGENDGLFIFFARPKKTNQKKGRPVPWSFGLPCASRTGRARKNSPPWSGQAVCTPDRLPITSGLRDNGSASEIGVPTRAPSGGPPEATRSTGGESPCSRKPFPRDIEHFSE